MPKTLDRPPTRRVPSPVPVPVRRRNAPAVSAADIVEQFGDVDLDRIVTDPAPGTATEADLDRIRRTTDRLCELIDGTLIEKAGSLDSAMMASGLLVLLTNRTRGKKLGWVIGADGFVRLGGRRVRAADVSFIDRAQLPEGRIPRSPGFPDLYPKLAVELLSPSNRPGEMRRKRRDFFEAGTRLIWEIDPAAGTCAVYTAATFAADGPDAEPDEVIRAGGLLDGRDVLPGVSVPLDEVLAAVNLD